jgi:hypothetical protein
MKEKFYKPALSGDRNQCPSCGELFNSTYAFDKHRTGSFGVDRRCMTAHEMKACGMSKNSDLFWISQKMKFVRES